MMPNPMDSAASRRRFLKFLAGSPLLAMWFPTGSIEQLLAAALQKTTGLTPDEPSVQKLIASPDQAINVFDFESVARQTLPPAHWGYMTTGVDDDVTLQANRAAFSKFQIRPRRLVDVSRIDTSVEIFGVKWKTPIIIAPVGSQRAFHPQGELATAKAAGSRGHLQILSTVTTTSVEDVIAARGAPVWYQLYPTSSWDVARALAQRAEAAGSPVLVVTVDSPAGRNRETQERLRRVDTRTCTNCHLPGFAAYVRRKPMFDNLELKGVNEVFAPGLNWDFVRRLKDTVKMKLVLKGIVTREDAALCVEHGIDGIVVSNHGGRVEETGRSTIECLSEVVEAVGGRIPVLIDGGFRRGTDIFKALALGAKAVGIGRPYVWGLAAFGQSGVEKVLDILRAEFELMMKQAGVTSVDQIKRTYVVEGSR
jgi:isopentenyl diphosphate isomerase/L-lactate dehydrogenase-like FMN-dependent dehydrogenase